jgi:alpha/beta superfamily hydrolase
VPGANHFFADQQEIVADHITGYLKKSLADKAAQGQG